MAGEWQIKGVARMIAGSGNWVIVHLAIVGGLILMLEGLLALGRSLQLEGGLSGAVSQLGRVAAVAGITVGLILVTLDGLAAKHLADAWAEAPPEEKAIALRIVTSEETFNFALAALFNILFAGVTFILYGLAVAGSRRYPRWLGWVVVVAGAGSVIAGLVQAHTGESTGLTQVLTIAFPTIITLWVVDMSVLLLRKLPPQRPSRHSSHRLGPSHEGTDVAPPHHGSSADVLPKIPIGSAQVRRSQGILIRDEQG